MPLEKTHRGELIFEPGERVLCPHVYLGHDNDRCNRFFYVVPRGYVVRIRPLEPDDRSPAGAFEYDEPCRRCKRPVRIRKDFDQRTAPRDA